MEGTSRPEATTSEWDGGWDAHRQAQVRERTKATHLQRLAWLEEAIAFAHAAGALGPMAAEPPRPDLRPPY